MIGNHLPLTLIAGPCQIENLEHSLMIAAELAKVAEKHRVGFIFKSSFDKANRTSHLSKRGVGIESGLEILAKVREKIGCPILTDVHDKTQCELASKFIDILQIPAFLCRQTDLLTTAAETGCAINIKKGQFLAPWDMTNVIAKIEEFGNRRILLCERGSSFGYNTLVTDMRSLPIMAQTGYPIVIDATHSVQQPGGKGTSSGGQREFVPVIARAAVAVGVAALFIETHENPNIAPSDGANMIPLEKVDNLIGTLMSIDKIAKSNPL